MVKQKTHKTRKKNIKKKHHTQIYSKQDYNSNDGMLTSVWGPPAWHFLHTISFNYPAHPSKSQKKQYKTFFMGLENVLPCGHCRKNFRKNITQLPLNDDVLKNRCNFSKWVFELHELINTMLGKKSGLNYEQIRERYEHFRSRCTLDEAIEKVRTNKKKNKTKKTSRQEKGCTKALYGKKSKCVMQIVPNDSKIKSLSIDKECIKKLKIN